MAAQLLHSSDVCCVSGNKAWQWLSVLASWHLLGLQSRTERVVQEDSTLHIWFVPYCMTGVWPHAQLKCNSCPVVSIGLRQARQQLHIIYGKAATQLLSALLCLLRPHVSHVQQVAPSQWPR